MNDSVDRQAAIDAINSHFGFNIEEEYGSAVQEVINGLPSAQPEPKTGKWVGADSQCGIGCPFCGMPVDDFCSSIDYIDLRYEPNFCPNCGADMRGEQDESNK